MTFFWNRRIHFNVSIQNKCFRRIHSNQMLPWSWVQKTQVAFSCQMAVSSGKLYVRTLRDVTQVVQST